MAVRYVNTASTAGGDGTTNATTGANRAYASLNEWEAARQAVLSEPEECICEGATADATAVVISGWTLTAANYISIYTTQANRHGGKWNTGKYRLAVGHALALRIQEDYVRLDGLQISSTFTYATAVGIVTHDALGTAGEFRISNCIIKEASASGYGGYGLIFSYVTGVNSYVAKVWNTIIYDVRKSGAFGIKTEDTDWVLHCHNVAIHNCDTSFYNNAGTFNAKNCGSAAAITAAFSGTITQTTCSSTTPTFVDETNDDFHLAAGDTTWKDVGTDLSGDANLAFSVDIDGETRSGTWDIGADEYIAAGGGAKFPVPHLYWSEA